MFVSLMCACVRACARARVCVFVCVCVCVRVLSDVHDRVRCIVCGLCWCVCMLGGGGG